MIENWIYKGVIDDPYQEFLLKEQKKDVNLFTFLFSKFIIINNSPSDFIFI